MWLGGVLLWPSRVLWAPKWGKEDYSAIGTERRARGREIAIPGHVGLKGVQGSVPRPVYGSVAQDNNTQTGVLKQINDKRSLINRNKIKYGTCWKSSGKSIFIAVSLTKDRNIQDWSFEVNRWSQITDEVQIEIRKI